MMSNVENLTPRELLALHAWIMDELRARGITRSSNSPTGDLADTSFAKPSAGSRPTMPTLTWMPSARTAFGTRSKLAV